MKSKELLVLFLFVAWTSSWGSVQSAPIRLTQTTLDTCHAGNFFGEITHCCPPATYTKGPIVEFIPKRDHIGPHRVRKALQCLAGDELRIYSEQLWRAYDLMKALPMDDPRSFYQQNALHCAYGSGAFIQDGTANLTIDVHFNWYFSPWHRQFIYFHERILQSLLNDTTFSLHFWNFDNNVDGESHGKDGCYRKGYLFPELYSDPSKSTFHANRSERPFIANLPLDLTVLNRSDIPLRFASVAVPRNRELMHRAMAAGNTSLDFHGVEFKHGDPQNLDINGGGSLEFLPHNSVHRWIGGSTALTTHAPEDPIFYVFHSNLERLWDVWQKLGNSRTDPSTPDWLDAEFLFFDENAVVRSVKVRDSLSTEDFGYSYEKVFDESWISYDNSTSTTPTSPASPTNT
ncbi:polyphenol oxidase [Marchantia polymorpha subsp. ruderalis]|uniref:Tyrosinase copper-binding domain-containing protein n=1 Tax=Marchantia polymorpha TaxID=3197 RepID=A0A2R6XDH9_MARPO|nr:hypothetical protein MARPO_0021s0034 [Marchantia polymorpha]BBN01227.1 hypothetical protein Mp_2g05780 [Marchantia polymorpha subsp. ruderalis]|eukprot:PTQ44153.1 hypothetical protein MARPO_0021s0034 [Marchantia polymorpha]